MMKHTTDFERPIDWLAARGLTSTLEPDSDCFGDLSVTTVKKLAKQYKKETNSELIYRDCLHEVVKALGFEGWPHYVDFMKRRGEFESSDDKKIKIEAKKSAKKQARYWLLQLKKKERGI